MEHTDAWYRSALHLLYGAQLWLLTFYLLLTVQGVWWYLNLAAIVAITAFMVFKGRALRDA